MDISNLNPVDFRAHLVKRFKRRETAEQIFEGIFRNARSHKLSFDKCNSLEQILQNLKRVKAVPSDFSKDDLLSVARSFDFRVRDLNNLKKILSQGEVKKYTVLDAENDLRAKLLCPYTLSRQRRFYLEIPGLEGASPVRNLNLDESVFDYESEFKRVLGIDLGRFLEASNDFYRREFSKAEMLSDLFDGHLVDVARMLEQFKDRPQSYLERVEIGFVLNDHGQREKFTRTVAEILCDFFEERFPADQSFRRSVDLKFINYLNEKLSSLLKQGEISKFHLNAPSHLMDKRDNADLLLNLLMDYFWGEKKAEIPGSTQDQIDLNNQASGESLS